MPRIPTRLGSDLAIRKLKAAQKHPVRYAVAGEPPGLYIQVTPNDAKSWLLRITTGVRPHAAMPGAMTQVRREFGLDKYPTIGLQAARDKAATYPSKTSQGIDPNAERKQRSVRPSPLKPSCELSATERKRLSRPRPRATRMSSSRRQGGARAWTFTCFRFLETASSPI